MLKEPATGKTEAKTMTDRVRSPKTDAETIKIKINTKNKTEITSTSGTNATYPATRDTIGQFVGKTLGIEAIIPTMPLEITAAIRPEAPIPSATTIPVT